MYYAMDLLRIVAELHAAHVIHTDIKPDNLLLRQPATSHLPDWQSSRPGMWQDCGLCLIDFGRAVDTALLPTGTLFKVDRQPHAATKWADNIATCATTGSQSVAS